MCPTLHLETRAQRQEAQHITEQIASDQPLTLELSHNNLKTSLSPSLSNIVVDLLRNLAQGGHVTISSAPEFLTTTEAAHWIGVSRPTLMKAVRAGEIESFKVGAHTRFTTEEVERFASTRHSQQRKAFDTLREFDTADDIFGD
ncbi:MAG: helix-turn-helix domain-containing protein [Ancrocorticia sp.]|jgi:excisionase family DNA binding protein|nr:helix-turn-helix domain-containing protein [Ancrocorticia sp.]